MSKAVWRTTWSLERLRQREFMCFGMDILLSLNATQTREFFDAFFKLSDFEWQGYLSSRLTFAQLIPFGINVFIQVGYHYHYHYHYRHYHSSSSYYY